MLHTAFSYLFLVVLEVMKITELLRFQELRNPLSICFKNEVGHHLSRGSSTLAFLTWTVSPFVIFLSLGPSQLTFHVEMTRSKVTGERCHGFFPIGWDSLEPSQSLGFRADAVYAGLASSSPLSIVQGPIHPLAHASLR